MAKWHVPEKHFVPKRKSRSPKKMWPSQIIWSREGWPRSNDWEQHRLNILLSDSPNRKLSKNWGRPIRKDSRVGEWRHLNSNGHRRNPRPKKHRGGR